MNMGLCHPVQPHFQFKESVGEGLDPPGSKMTSMGIF